MSTILRDAPVGQIIRWMTKNKALQYPEEKAGFEIPEGYHLSHKSVSSTTSPSPASRELRDEKLDNETSEKHNLGNSAEHTTRPTLNETPTARPDEAHNVLTTSATVADTDLATRDGAVADRNLSKIVTRTDMRRINTRSDLEEAYTNATRQETLKNEPSRAIMPERTADGVILVDWYTTDDAENPQNWASKKKLLVVLQIYIYTLAVYIGSAIYTPSEPYVAAKFGVSGTVASLGLSMYVLGYGLGPLFFSPLSEIPIIGRNPPYMVTFGIFVILCVPTALVNNFPALVVLRFFQGLFGSPCLATGGASIGDIYSLINLPYFLTFWAAFATAGPSLGPLIAGFSVPATNWHWSLWEILWIAGPTFISLMFLLPETSGANILLRRAQRLRKLTGNQNLKSQSEIDQASLSVGEVVVGNLWRPLQINALDPAVLFTSIYTALMYSIYYTFFEVFPLVYAVGQPGTPTHGYGMNAGEIGLIFLSITVGVAIAIFIYVVYLYYVFNPDIMKNGLGAPERRLIPALYACFLLPVSLFMFAWTANSSPKIHWIVPTIAIAIFTIGIFLLFQCLFIYIPLTYPQYAASLFAGNDFARSALAAGAIHYATPLFNKLGVGKGVSLLAGLTVGGVFGIFALWKFGANLRARSKFAAK